VATVNLVSTSDTLSVITSAAALVDMHASWIDYDGTPGTIPGRHNEKGIGAATTVLVGSPGSGVYRTLKAMHLRNRHATAQTDVTIKHTDGTTDVELHKATLQPGDMLEYLEGLGFVEIANPALPLIGRVLTADDAGGQLVATDQPWFPTNPALTVAAATTYWMRGLLKIVTGATSHSTALSFTGTATLTSIDYYAQAHRSAVETIISVFSGINVISAAAAVVDVAGVQVGHYIQVNGMIRINGAGTLIPNFKFSANPTTSCTVKRNSYFWLREIPGGNAIDRLGTWT
jgi:hypothetical protein